MGEQALPPPQAVIRLLMGFISARAVYAAAKLGVADHIEIGGSTPRQVATAVNADHAAVERLLRALTGFGLLHAEGDGRFVLTPLGETLRINALGSVHDYAIYVHEFLYDLFGAVVRGVRGGGPVVEEIFGAPLFAFLQGDPERAALFHAGLGNRGQIEAPAILNAYSFAGFARVVDLGGDNGAFLSAILATHPEVSGVLLERAPAIAAAREGGGGPLPRCELVEGDYFQSVPPGGDVYVLKRVLFDHSPEEVIQIFRNCRAAMGRDSLLLIIEGLAAPPNEADPAHLMDLVYLLATTGHMRTESEYGHLLRGAGLRLRRRLATQSEVTILEAVHA
jgi:O-methyltransferase domain/Dimerisation domain